MSVLLQEAISDGGERLGGELLGAFALQVAVEGGDGYSGVNCVALRVKGGAVGHAKKTAARVGMDIGTLGGKLGGIDRHDIAIAWVEERGKRGERNQTQREQQALLRRQAQRGRQMCLTILSSGLPFPPSPNIACCIHT